MRACLLCCGLLLAAPALVRAEPVGFAYSYSAGTGYLEAGGYGPIDLSSTASEDGQSLSVSFGGNRVDLTFASGTDVATRGDPGVLGPPTRVPMATVTFTPAALPGKSDFSFDAYFSGAMKLTDLASGESYTFDLEMDVWGYSADPAGATVAAWLYRGTWELPLLGGTAYDASPVDWVWVSGYEGELVGQLYVDVVVGDPEAGGHVPDDYPDGDPQPTAAPEPSALLLGGVGVCLLALTPLRRRLARRGAWSRSLSAESGEPGR